MTIPWQALELDDVLKRLEVSGTGLARDQARDRLEKHGPNLLSAKEKNPAFEILLAQFKNFLILLLIVAAVVSMVIGLADDSVQELIEGGLILLIVVFIVVVGFYQEYHAASELDALRKMLQPEAVVLRDGQKVRIFARDLVPGDLVLLEAGDQVPADGRLIEAVELSADESVLTGEAEPVAKKLGVSAPDLPLGDRINLVFMGTRIISGKGRMVVVATGMETEFGKIAGQIQKIEERRTPLQERLDALGRQIGLGVIGLCLLIFLVGWLLKGTPFLTMFLVAVALAVAAVPEGLPGVVTAALAVGTRRMVRRNVIVRSLPAVETLGSTTVICSDKTGTITRNEMTVRKLVVAGEQIDVEGEGYTPEGGFSRNGQGLDPREHPLVLDFLTGAALCNNAGLSRIEGEWKITGDPTEAALIVAAAKAGVSPDDLEKDWPRVREVPFSSERKRMASVHRTHGGWVTWVKGAPDVVLDLSSEMMTEKGPRPLDETSRESVMEANQSLAQSAFRVLAVAMKKTDRMPREGQEDQGLVFVGLAAMMDPPREDARQAIKNCLAAGVRTVMITGDHQATALAVGREVGLAAEPDQVLTGAQLTQMSDKELEDRALEVNLYARVSPEHKLRIVTALQNRGQVVAMTGDGVNDAPALRRADIGVAMGITGTDVSKEAADMVLLDDNFASIVGAVEEGRGIYDNIKKCFAYLISGNLVEVALVFVTSMFESVPIALTATQILIINLISDGLPALALSVDPFEPKAMERPPRPKTEPLSKGLSPFIVYYPILVTMVGLGLFFWVYDPALNNAVETQTTVFLTVAFSEMFQAFAARSVRYPSFRVGLFENRWLVGSSALALVICLGLVYLPIRIPGLGFSLQELVGVQPLRFDLLLTILVLSSLGYFFLEGAKAYSSGKGKDRLVVRTEAE